MIRKLQQCFTLYARDPGFMIISVLGFLSLCAMQILVYWGIEKNLWSDTIVSVPAGGKHLEILVNRFMFGDDLLTIIFVLGSCVMFAFGLLIKRQFANDRASLLPGYRLPHTATAFAILLIFVVVTFLLSNGAMKLAQMFFMQVLAADISLTAIYLVVLIMAVTMLYIGYLSIAYLVVAGYVALLLFGQNLVPILNFFSTQNFACGIGFGFLLIMLMVFAYRLFTLKSEHLEYPFLLTWPPRKTLRNQMAFPKIFNLPLKENVVPAYFKDHSTWSRANHWRFAEESSIHSLVILWLIGLPLYYLFLKSPWAEFYMTGKVQTNFLLLAGAPVLLTLITNYKSMMFYSCDLLKPVSRKNFFKQQGVKFLVDLSIFWLMIAGYFAVIPDALRGAGQMVESQYWIFLFLTYAFALLNLTWLAAISAKDNSRTVILNGFFLCVLIMAEFFLAGRTSSGWIALNAGLCLLGSGLFAQRAFAEWMSKEF
jgi:hypothetical protein